MLRAWLAGALAVFLWASAAGAQPIDAAAAEALFKEGRAAYDAGDYPKACAKFSESQRLDPGAGTLINLAACREKLNQLASAWEAWQQALTWLPKGDPRIPEVKKRADALEARVPKLVIELAPGAPEDSDVVRDGIRLGKAALGVAIPVDPGPHQVEVSAPGRETKRFDKTLAEGVTEKLVVEPGELIPLAPVKPDTLKTIEPKRDRAPKKKKGGDATLGVVVMGIGGVALGVGAAAGLAALNKKKTLDERCTSDDGTRRCDQQGLDAAESGKTFATVSTIAFAVGGVAVAAGVYLILSSGSDSTSVGAVAAPHSGSMVFRRRF
jgi:hypothetical protein